MSFYAAEIFIIQLCKLVVKPLQCPKHQAHGSWPREFLFPATEQCNMLCSSNFYYRICPRLPYHADWAPISRPTANFNLDCTRKVSDTAIDCHARTMRTTSGSWTRNSIAPRRHSCGTREALRRHWMTPGCRLSAAWVPSNSSSMTPCLYLVQ